MKLSDFDYNLPKELIAFYPAARREEARLMVIDRKQQKISHCIFRELPSLLPQPGILVRNNTKVFPARLRGRKTPQGGKVEVLLCKKIKPDEYEAMVRPARRLKTGQMINFKEINGEIIQELNDGKRLIRFDDPVKLSQAGEIPLPPYIDRDAAAVDIERYQTVYAKQSGSVAAPTAGLHFTPQVIKQLQERDVDIVDVTLHVGPGTFKPVKDKIITNHRMDYEEYSLTQDSLDKIKDSRRSITAVGTTSVRVIETVAADKNMPLSGKTNLFIYPGYKFKRVDHLLTNFHLPRSTLLMLVSAFAGVELIQLAYRTAVTEKYRFYSYGDAMLIL